MDDEYCKGYENQNLSYNVNKISGKEQLNKLYLLIYEINIFRLQSELLSISHPINLSLKKKRQKINPAYFSSNLILLRCNIL